MNPNSTEAKKKAFFQSQEKPRDPYTTCATPDLPHTRCPGTCDETSRCPAYLPKNASLVLTR